MNWNMLLGGYLVTITFYLWNFAGPDHHVD